MQTSKADIIARLKKEILPLQGFKPAKDHVGFDAGLGLIKQAFPNATFPLGAVHEFFCDRTEDVSASCGFIAGIAGAIMQSGGVVLWISSSRMIFPPALQMFSIEPDKNIFIDLKKENEILWVMEEALKCEGLAAVIADTPEISFTASRRLQLAVEQSRATGFIIRQNPGNLATACITRWRIKSLPANQQKACLAWVSHDGMWSC